MLLKSSDAKTLRFDFDKTCGINAKSEDHMHALSLTFVDASTIEQAWQLHEGGKRSEKSPTFTFKRGITKTTPRPAKPTRSRQRKSNKR